MKARKGPLERCVTFTVIIMISNNTTANRINIEMFCGWYIISVKFECVIISIGEGSIILEVRAVIMKDRVRVVKLAIEIDGWFGVSATKYENMTSIPPM